jgi:putative intracellular protease/amidase
MTQSERQSAFNRQLRRGETGDWGVNVVTDGLLITGQNPASSGPAAKELLDLLAKKV